MAFRASIGDNEMNDFLETKDGKLLAWVIWLAIMIVGNMILMNISIAIVNSNYEYCRENEEAMKIKAKIDIIVEIESIMTDPQL